MNEPPLSHLLRLIATATIAAVLLAGCWQPEVSYFSDETIHRIKGYVVDSLGNPQEGIRVAVESFNVNDPYDSVENTWSKTDQNGYYEMLYTPSGYFKSWLNINGFLARHNNVRQRYDEPFKHSDPNIFGNLIQDLPAHENYEIDLSNDPIILPLKATLHCTFIPKDSDTEDTFSVYISPQKPIKDIDRLNVMPLLPFRPTTYAYALGDTLFFEYNLEWRRDLDSSKFFFTVLDQSKDSLVIDL